MDPARWERVQELFHGAVTLPESDRARFLQAECAGDHDLAGEVQSMLDEDARGASLLERDVAQVASDVLNGASSALSSGTLPDFRPYTIKRLLGEGGMGVVYLAERRDLGSLAAIKVLRDAWLSPARRERFAAEQRTLAQLSHPSIAQLHDASTLADGTPWFVMEYVEGVPLTEYCRTHATSIEGRLELVRAVCVAVQYAHGQAVIHRDLKPSNILVKADGTVKLLDFGIAKHLESLETPVDQTRTGLRLMTPAYAAPEQLRGDRVGIHTDVYSLGVVLYELLAGAHPFNLQGQTPAEAMSILSQQEPERPSVVARRRTGDEARPRARSATASWSDLDVLCLTAMHRDPARRYPTVEALIRDIDHYLAGEPLEARPDAIGYRLGKFVRRHRAAVAASTLVLAAVIGLVVFYTVRLTAARNAAVAEAARTQRIQRFMLNLFSGGDDVAGPADNLRVATLVDRGVQEARALDGEPVVQAELYRTLGGIYQKLGNFPQADTLLRSALDRHRALFGPDDPEVATSLVELGLLRVDQAQLDEAERLVREGLELATRRHGPAHPAVARATAALGQTLEARGAYDKAIAANDEAVRLYSAVPGADAELTAALGQLADSHYYAGHYDTADSINQRVLAGTRRLYGERHPRVADILINLGASQGDRGRYAEAETLYRQALEILTSFYGAEHFRTASGMTMLGRVLVYQRKFPEGVALLGRALAVQERVNGPVHPRVASALNDLGAAALQEKRLDEAQARFTRMLEIYRAVYGKDHYLIGIATSNLASVLIEKQQYVRAEELYRDAVAIYERAQGPRHLNTGIGRVKLGRALLRQQRYVEAERELVAGYEILSTQASPSVSWLKSARTDLVAVYDALKQPDKAEKYRAELKANAAPAGK